MSDREENTVEPGPMQNVTRAAYDAKVREMKAFEALKRRAPDTPAETTARIEAATVQRIVAWLREGRLVDQPWGHRERVSYDGAADLIEREFGEASPVIPAPRCERCEGTGEEPYDPPIIQGDE